LEKVLEMMRPEYRKIEDSDLYVRSTLQEPSMRVRIAEVGPDRLADYASVPIKLIVKSSLQDELVASGLGGILLR
jgi:hypothetical protein